MAFSKHKNSRKSAGWLLLCLAFAAMAFTPESDGNEYQIKAMFVFNFTKYVEWPEKATSNFTIAVAGESEITGAMEAIAAQKKIGNKKINVGRLSSDMSEDCDIIIVPASRLNKLEAIEKHYANKGVLIITDESARPAAINLVTKDNKVRFEINQQLAKMGGVKISGQLLSLAITVH